MDVGFTIWDAVSPLAPATNRVSAGEVADLLSPDPSPRLAWVCLRRGPSQVDGATIAVSSYHPDRADPDAAELAAEAMLGLAGELGRRLGVDPVEVHNGLRRRLRAAPLYLAGHVVEGIGLIEPDFWVLACRRDDVAVAVTGTGGPVVGLVPADPFWHRHIAEILPGGAA